jgi:endonuclease/exonuclease/phosphatase (EEP) superfamily protein YafD
LGRLGADVAVIQECSEPRAANSGCLWFGNPGKLGVAVQVRSPFTVKLLPTVAGVAEYLVPLEITGPVNFTLFAVWTLSESKYIRGLVSGIEQYADLFRDESAVVMGDLNSNAKWDNEHPKHLNHSAFAEKMSSLKMVSAYHHHRNEVHGCELEHTYYHHGKREKPHHIDYAFVPQAWSAGIQDVSVGSYDDWAALSDHRPLIVDLHVNPSP